MRSDADVAGSASAYEDRRNGARCGADSERKSDRIARSLDANYDGRRSRYRGVSPFDRRRLTYAAPLVTPASGQPINLAAGVTATFADDGTTPANTFVVGDIHSFTLGRTDGEQCVDPRGVRSAPDAAFRSIVHYNFIHVGAPATVALGVSIGTLADEMAPTINTRFFFVLEARAKADGEP